MFTHEYNDNGDHRITYNYKGAQGVVGQWYNFAVPAVLSLSSVLPYIAFTTYQYPAKSPTTDSLQYAGPYADVVYKLSKVA